MYSLTNTTEKCCFYGMVWSFKVFSKQEYLQNIRQPIRIENIWSMFNFKILKSFFTSLKTSFVRKLSFAASAMEHEQLFCLLHVTWGYLYWSDSLSCDGICKEQMWVETFVLKNLWYLNFKSCSSHAIVRVVNICISLQKCVKLSDKLFHKSTGQLQCSCKNCMGFLAVGMRARKLLCVRE